MDSDKEEASAAALAAAGGSASAAPLLPGPMWEEVEEDFRGAATS